MDHKNNNHTKNSPIPGWFARTAWKPKVCTKQLGRHGKEEIKTKVDHWHLALLLPLYSKQHEIQEERKNLWYFIVHNTWWHSSKCQRPNSKLHGSQKSLSFGWIEPTKRNHVSSFKKCSKPEKCVGCSLEKQKKKENNERKGTQWANTH